MEADGALDRCIHCGGALSDDTGMSWPYCPRCDWCPDCGVTHEDRSHEVESSFS